MANESPMRNVPLRELGTTALRVTPICVGSAALGNMPEAFAYSVSDDDAVDTIRQVFDGPITFIDTAASYGDGESERRFGTVIRERGGLPAGFVLATKVDRDLHNGDFSGSQMQRSLERSLRLLGLERLQLVYLHDPEHTTFESAMAPGGPVEALVRAKADGMVEHIGVAGGPIDVMTRYVETGHFEVAISHNRYTLLNSSAADFWDVCARHAVAAVNAAPYGSGILVQGPDAYARYAYQDADPDLLDRARRIEAICSEHEVPLAAAALQFSTRDSRIASTIVGMTRPEHVDETVRLFNYPIPDALWDELATVPPSKDDPEAQRFR